MIAAWLALGLSARAETPLPSYRDALARERWDEVDGVLTDGCATERFPVVCTEGTIARALALVDAYQRQVTPDAGLEYLAGLANRYGGHEREAVRRYTAAIALDPSRADAWYDLGEIHMTRGDLDEAVTCFGHVSELRADAELGWLGPWRIAEIAALRHDAAGFEDAIKEALRRGFSFRQIAGQENWRAFYADPALTDTLDKLLTVYAEPGVRDSLLPRRPPPPPR